MMRTAGLVQIVSVVVALSVSARANAQWSLTGPYWDGDWSISLDPPGSTATWGPCWSKSTATADPVFPLDQVLNAGSANTMGFFTVTKQCASAPKFTTYETSEGHFYYQERCWNYQAPPQAGDDNYLVLMALSVSGASTKTEQEATLTGTAITPAKNHDAHPEETSISGGYNLDMEPPGGGMGDDGLGLATNQEFTSSGYVKLYLYTRAEAKSAGAAAHAYAECKTWGYLYCNQQQGQ